ncbi:ricin-like [Mercurialis annua]|uniref:ricin-like n=1 Tax=Mercurialis annua TaxID=3986 RepID=UPI00215EF8F5|nr:ricin-like [Mercurialis annua]
MRATGGSLLVQLSNGETKSVTFAISVTNAYIIAFRAGSYVHYFPGTPQTEVQNAFPDVAPENRHQLPFGESYTSLDKAANGTGREELDLGADPLQRAVSSLYYNCRNGRISRGAQAVHPARHLIVSIQMIAESARFYIISGRISAWIYNSEQNPPEPDMLEYENSLGGLSRRIQESGENGVFDAAQLRDRRNQPIFVSNVNDFYVRCAIALMIYVCRPHQQSQFSRLIIIKDDTSVLK